MSAHCARFTRVLKCVRSVLILSLSRGLCTTGFSGGRKRVNAHLERDVESLRHFTRAVAAVTCVKRLSIEGNIGRALITHLINYSCFILCTCRRRGSVILLCVSLLNETLTQMEVLDLSSGEIWIKTHATGVHEELLLIKP